MTATRVHLTPNRHMQGAHPMTAIAMTRIPVGRARSLLALARLDLARSIRNQRYLVLTIGFPAVFYLLYTGVLQTGDASRQRIGDIPWPTYFMASMAAYGALTATLGGSRLVAGERVSGWTRQLRITPLPASAYVITRLIVSLLSTVPAILLVTAVGVLANGVSLDVPRAIALVLLLAVGSLPFAALGVLIGYLFDGDSAQGATMAALFGLAILGGLWAPVATFPTALGTIARMLPSYRLADLGWRLVGGAAPDLADVLLLLGYGILFGALVAWRYRVDGRRADR
jgi:ABC-2 type transport system permease protein